MMRLRMHSLLPVILGFAIAQAGLRAEAPGDKGRAPDFKEVYDLVREHLAGVSEGQLNDKVVRGLVATLAPRVSLVTNAGAAGAAGDTPLVIKSSVFDGDILYVRVGRVGEGLAQAIRTACRKLETTNKLKGVALDLRYAGGDDYAAAAAAADLFVKKEQPLLNWGNGMVRSKAKTDVIGLPAAVLVNHQTAGAAEALAAAMRETGAALILGSRTAGQAMVAQEFPLKNGDRLRIATAPILLGDGSALSEQGLKPDIDVDVNPDDERAYYADAFKATDKTNLQANATTSTNGVGNGTNRVARRPRFNEAELVRERREGISEADVTAFRSREPDQPTVQDPTLARALDLLRGLALVRQPRS
jgi:hypothetical protein